MNLCKNIIAPIQLSSQHVVTRSLTPPPIPLFKINVGGAVFEARKAIGVGVIIRDDKGKVIAALTKKIEAPLMDAIWAKAKAYETSICFAPNVGLLILFWRVIL